MWGSSNLDPLTLGLRASSMAIVREWPVRECKLEVYVHSLGISNPQIVLLFVVVTVTALTITAGAVFAWKGRKDEDELPPLSDLQATLAKMMQDSKASPNKSAWV